jgi:hypothetical protein
MVLAQNGEDVSRKLTAAQIGAGVAMSAQSHFAGKGVPPAFERTRLLGLPIPHHVADAADPDVTRLGKPPTNS